MTHPPLDDVCRHVGVATSYPATGPVPETTKRRILAALGVDPEAPLTGAPAPDRIVVPKGVSCFRPDWLTDQPGWGLTCQLYELRSDRSWGIGDFRDLADLATIAGKAGADFLGINPLHALFMAAPELRSPFTPSNRSFLYPIYIAMDDLPCEAPADAALLDQLRAADLVDYVQVARAKLKGLGAVFEKAPFGDGRFAETAFEAFCREGGLPLRRHALFEALSFEMTAQGYGVGWTTWPAPYQAVDSPEVAAFARDNTTALAFHLWLQWISSIQLDAARQAAREAGMRIGIYLDLAVGEAADGSATWSAPDLALRDLTIGAPPDVFAQEGQNWHLTATSPTALAAADFVPFRNLIGSQLRYAGALRIDHAMALWQLFMIPAGETADHGAHVRYPFADLISIIAEESQRGKAIIIGEDLGWVPPGFREAMGVAGLLSSRILYFEQEFGLFRRTDTYPKNALATISTHDLPVLARWWSGEDVTLRQRFGLIDAQSANNDLARRVNEKQALVAAFVDGGQLPPGAVDACAEDLPEAVLVAAHRFLADTPCLLVGARLADMIGPADPTNIPGTIDQYPNWQPRAPVSVDRIADHPAFLAVTAALRAERPRKAS